MGFFIDKISSTFGQVKTGFTLFYIWPMDPTSIPDFLIVSMGVAREGAQGKVTTT